jgi:chemotaxis protein MotB
MVEKQKAKPIIIKKIKKGGHGGHHGGAWKVAYADFVTAMMAFFLLLWLLSSVPQEKLKSLAEFFTPTIGIRDQMGIGFEGGSAPNAPKGVKDNAKIAPAIVFGAPSPGPIVKVPDSIKNPVVEQDTKNFTSMQHDLYKAINENPELKEFSESIIIDQTPEGLRIQLLDQDKRPMFLPGTSTLQPYTKKILEIVAKFIRYLPNYISIDGHTAKDHNPGTYDNWELSSQRANSARKFLVDGNIDPEQILRIVGKSDQEPFDVKDPYAPRNMRMGIILLRNSILPYQKQIAPEALLFDKDKEKDK